jgi:hypothetical protein
LLVLGGLKNNQALGGQAAEVALLKIPPGRIPLLRGEPEVLADRIQD